MFSLIKKHPIRTFTVLQPVFFSIVHYLSSRGIIGQDEVVLITSTFEAIAAGLVGRQVIKDKKG